MGKPVRHWKGNLNKMISLSKGTWSKIRQSKLTNISVKASGNILVDETGHEFINMVSCDYLGISKLPIVHDEIKKFLDSQTPFNLFVSSVRIKTSFHQTMELELEKFFDANCIITLSASEAAYALLPLLAAGFFHKEKKPVMVFDQGAHFSLKYVAPICKYETEVLQIDKDDIDSLKKICETRDRVVYVTDSVYSLGGYSEIQAIKELQEKYNLYVCYDEAHSLSIFGDRGEGLVRPNYQEFPQNTFVIASFSKGFGAVGGAIFMSKKYDKEMIRAVGGPLGWSQSITDPMLAVIKGSLSVHNLGHIGKLQDELRQRREYFDALIDTPQKGSKTPMRLIAMNSLESTIEHAQIFYQSGYYLAPIFFPIVPRESYALRLMLRSDIHFSDIDNLKNLFEMQRINT